MTEILITPNMDLDPWTDLINKPIRLDAASSTIVRVGLLPDRTDHHRANVALLIRLPSGTLLIAETTWRLWQQVTAILTATPVAQLEEP